MYEEFLRKKDVLEAIDWHIKRIHATEKEQETASQIISKFEDLKTEIDDIIIPNVFSDDETILFNMPDDTDTKLKSIRINFR